MTTLKQRILKLAEHEEEITSHLISDRLGISVNYAGVELFEMCRKGLIEQVGEIHGGTRGRATKRYRAVYSLDDALKHWQQFKTNRKRASVRKSPMHHETVQAHLQTVEHVTSRDVAELLGIKNNHAVNVVRRMVRMGMLEKCGQVRAEGKGRPSYLYRSIPEDQNVAAPVPMSLKHLQQIANVLKKPMVHTEDDAVFPFSDYQPSVDGKIKHVAYPGGAA